MNRHEPPVQGQPYAVRFEGCYRDDTRIIYLTDGVFQCWLQGDPQLRGGGLGGV